MKWDEDKLITVRNEHEEWLMGLPFVQGSGIGYDEQGQLCIKILTDSANARDRELVRDHLRDIPVAFEETGPINAL